jgi:uncharacterized protein involved in outer membrane biogenesis
MQIKPTVKRKLKIIIITVGIVFSLYIIAALLLVTSFKSEIQSQFVAELNNSINGRASIGKFKVNIINNFPNASILAENISIAGIETTFPTKEIIEIEKIDLNLNLIKLITGQVELKKITIHTANVFISRLNSGALNIKSLVKPQDENKTNNSGTGFSKIEISIKNTRLVYEDTVVACNLFDLIIKQADINITKTSTGFTMQCKNVLQSNEIFFNKDKGALLENQILKMHFLVDWNQSTKRYTLLPSRIKNNNSSFFMHGSLTLKELPQVTLYIGNPDIMFNSATALTTSFVRENLSGYNFEKPISMHLYVNGELKPNSPIDHDIYFYTTNNNFISNDTKLRQATITGHYTNHQNDTSFNDETNTGLYISKMEGFYEGIPVAVQFKAINFSKPLIELRLKSDTYLSQLNNVIDTSIIRFNKGAMKMDLTITGFINKKHQTVSDSVSMISGSVELTNADFTVTKPQYHFEYINGLMSFEHGDLQFFKLPVTINKNKTHISGIFKDFSNSLFNPDIPLLAELAVITSNFNINNFKQPSAIENQVQKTNPINKSTKLIVNNLQANITLEANELIYKKLLMTHTSGIFTFKNNSIYCKSATAEISGGKAEISGNLNNLGSKMMPYSMDISLKNIDIEKILKGLNNFNQKTITSDAIDGKVTASIQLSGELNESYLPELATLNGKASIQVKEGALHGVEAIEDISSIIFKNKDFSEIDFATITHRSNIVSGDILIDEMSIKSSLLIFAIGGTYSFGNNTSLLVKVPINSIANADKKYLEKSVIKDDKIGLSLLFKITKVDGDLKISPILFQRKQDKIEELYN